MEDPLKIQPTIKHTNVSLALTVQLVVEFGFVIAIPLVVFGLAGKWLDAKTQHHNLFVLLGILLALILSVTILVKRINGIRKSLMHK